MLWRVGRLRPGITPSGSRSRHGAGSYLSAQEDVGGEPATAGIGIEIIVNGQIARTEQVARIDDEAIEARFDAADFFKTVPRPAHIAALRADRLILFVSMGVGAHRFMG